MARAQWATRVAVLRAVARSMGRRPYAKYADLLIARLYFRDACPTLMQKLWPRTHVRRTRLRPPGLLGPLPGFVRGRVRVRRWAGAEIGLYHARLNAQAALESVA